MAKGFTDVDALDEAINFSKQYCDKCKYNCEDIMGDICILHGFFICDGKDFEEDKI